ncbi:MAG TPA: PD-(D/E)XK nuclease family protein [Clostridia bacterium]
MKNRPKRRACLDIRHIILTPDRYTLQLERELMKDLGENGAFDVSVMTFDRLLYNEGAPSKYLSQYGGAMLIRKIIDENKLAAASERFLCFNRALLKGDFPVNMYQTIMQLKSCMISPNISVRTNNAHLNNKISDIKYIYQKYEQFLEENNLQDAGSKLNLLKKQAPHSEYIKNAYFYVFGFDSLTPQAADLLDTLHKCSKGVFLSVINDGLNLYPYIDIEALEPDIQDLSDFEKHLYLNLTKRNLTQYQKPAPINIFSASSPDSMIKEACRIIKKHIRNGGRLYEIAVIGDINEKDLAIFDEAEIIYNYDHKVLLTVHPFVAFIKDCIDAVRTHYNNGVSDIAKNYFSGIEYSDACLFENYCLKFNITKNIFEPFVLGEQDEIKTAERVRQRLAGILEPFESALKQSVTADDYVKAIKDFILNNALEDKLSKYNSKLATQDFAPYAAQCWDKFNAVLDELKILSQYKMSLEDFRAVFFAGLEAVEISVIPPKIDAVTITDIEGVRCGRFKKIIYLNCVDGSFPPLEKDLGLLSDDDLDSLGEYEIKIEPKIKQINKRRKFNLIQTFYHAKELYFLYSKNQSGQERSEASLLTALKTLFPIHREYSEEEQIILQSLDAIPSNKLDDAADFYYSQAFGKKQVLRLYKKAVAERMEILGLGVSAAARSLDARLDIERPQINIKTRLGGTFYATHLENYFSCPYIFLMRHILRLADRPAGDINSLDVGNILHEILEKFAAFKPADLEECERITVQILDQIISENIKLQKNPHFAEFLKKEAINTTKAVFEQNQKSDFETLYTEKKFGKGEELPPLPIETRYGTIYIGGKIDRIDVYKDYIKIIDYKSGGIKSSPKEIYCGVNLQLMLYMKACCQGLGKKPFASLYFPINNDFINEDKIRYRNIGLVAEEAEILLAADKTLLKAQKSDVLPVKVKSITTEYVELDSRQNSVLTSEEFENVLRYTEELTKNAVEEIFDGYFSPCPLERVCDWCDYRGICCRPYQNTRAFDQIKITYKTLAKLGKRE